MSESTIEYVRGFPEGLRLEAAELYDLAFGPKLGVAVRSEADRKDLIARQRASWTGKLVEDEG